MKPKTMMALGAFYGLIGFVALVLNPHAGAPLYMLAWVVGSLFGKGYGVWECRQALKGGSE